MENAVIQQIQTIPTKNKDLRIYKEGRNQELSNTAPTTHHSITIYWQESILQLFPFY